MHGDLLPLAREYLDRCFAEQSPPRASEFAQELGLSRTRLTARFLAECGTTLTALLKHEQIEIAKRLLRDTDLTITAIARRAAFGTKRSFRRAFVRATGMTPRAYRLALPKCPQLMGMEWCV